MTNEEIRIKVAEAMGWTDIRGDTGYPSSRARELGDYQALPNYPESLDACAEFEKTLTDAEHLRYRVQLWNVVITEGDEWTWDRQFISATARQRCIAYLKVKGILP